MFRAIIASVALALGTACALPGTSSGAPGHSPPDSIVVDVLNENYYAARIHAVHTGGQRRSLGTIPGNGGRARLALAWEPRALVFEVLLVTLGAAYVSYPVDVAPGESIDVRVPSNINESGFFRRVRRN